MTVIRRQHGISFISRCTLKAAVCLLLAVTVTGCSNLRLFSTDWQTIHHDDLQWYVASHRMDPALEALAVEAGQSRGVASEGYVTAVWLDRVGDVDLVEVIENPEHNMGRFSKKRVTYVRTRGSKAARVSVARWEPAPDPEFVAILYRTAVRAAGGFMEVVPYNDPAGNVTMAAHGDGKCHVTVRVMQPVEGGGPEIYRVSHNICQERQPLADSASR